MDERRRPAIRVGRQHAGLAAVLVLLGAAVGAYLSAPHGRGVLAYLVTGLVATVVTLVMPLVRRYQPRGAWLALSGSAGCFVTDLGLRVAPHPPPWGFFANPDAWAFGGYALMAVFLVILLRTSGQDAADALLSTDVAVVTIGGALFFWVLEVGPELTEARHLGTVLVTAAYPIFDALMLSLTVHLLLRQSEPGPAMYAFLTGMAGLLIGDVGYVFVWEIHPGADAPLLNVCYMIGFVGICVAATHPSGRLLGRHRTRISTGLGRRVNLSAAMLVPVLAVFLTTSRGQADTIVRAGLVGALLAAILIRFMRTIGALETAESLSRHRANFDALTGLANRSAFMTELDRRLALPGEALVALLFLDCDRFKEINDSWGHSVGDAVLQVLAARLSGQVHGSDRVYRLGADEFVVLAGPPTPGGAVAIAEQLLRSSLVPLEVATGQSVVLSPSIGLAHAVPGQCTGTELLRHADIAMYEAKAGGGAAVVIFDESLAEGVLDQALLVSDLRQALEEHLITPHFQPIKGGPGFGELVGFEALARWTHPVRGVVTPDRFIPVAEETGMIVDLGEQMLRASCRQLARWRQATGLDLHVSVNVSVIQLTRSDIPRLVLEVLADTGLPPAALWLELTESSLADRSGAVLSTLQELEGIGVVLCLDDFGTGYSSLSYLSDFPLSIIKIDKSFVDRLPDDPKATTLTETIIRMVAALGLTGVVAEGIETEAQAACLRGMGCSMGQGWLLGRPAAAEKITERFLADSGQRCGRFTG